MRAAISWTESATKMLATPQSANASNLQQMLGNGVQSLVALEQDRVAATSIRDKAIKDAEVAFEAAKHEATTRHAERLRAIKGVRKPDASLSYYLQSDVRALHLEDQLDREVPIQRPRNGEDQLDAMGRFFMEAGIAEREASDVARNIRIAKERGSRHYWFLMSVAIAAITIALLIFAISNHR
jgi:hypothetical protein